MANHHFGKFADVWKHLVLDEVLAEIRPDRYAETHAGSAAYPIVGDPERRFGVLGFLDGLASDAALAQAAFPRVVSGFTNDEPSTYPGSALQAMTLLGDGCSYLLCDLDPVSVEDLRTWAARLSLTRCEVAARDGMQAVGGAWLEDPAPTVVHIDPFDPFERTDGGLSAVELAAQVAEAGHTLVYWYGLSHPGERAWALDAIQRLTSAPLWCGDLMVTRCDGETRSDGDLGEATTPGAGCGVVLANVTPALTTRCEALGHALVDHYEGRELPNGEPGGLDLAVHTRS
jgi:23S rRNA (adenine2030-N6)-methyltransferase